MLDRRQRRTVKGLIDGTAPSFLTNLNQPGDFCLNDGLVVPLDGRDDVFFFHALKVSPPPANPGQMNGVTHRSLDSMVSRTGPGQALREALIVLLSQTDGRRLTVQQATLFVMVATASEHAALTIAEARRSGLGQAVTRSHSTLVESGLIEAAKEGSADGRERPLVLTAKGRKVWTSMMSKFESR